MAPLKKKIITIILKWYGKRTLIWKGVSKKDEFSSEDPVVLDFNHQEFYFYSQRIEEKNYVCSTKDCTLYKDLAYFQQEKLLKAFPKQINQKDWSRSILLKMKVTFLSTVVDILIEKK